MKRSRSYIATQPGATIKEQLKDKGMSREDFSTKMDMAEEDVSMLLDGETLLTPDIANRLETVLGLPAHFWSNLEAIYREKLQLVDAENAKDPIN